uniref:Uncharacterized protein n=1 Tax=Cannabis sativa TaxID=3483 RepID=A0A803QBY0_CANSA
MSDQEIDLEMVDLVKEEAEIGELGKDPTEEVILETSPQRKFPKKVAPIVYSSSIWEMDRISNKFKSYDMLQRYDEH